MTVNTKWDLNAPIEGAENFTLAELIHSDTADRLKIDNQPPAAVADSVYENLTYLAQTVLQPLRDWMGEPLYVSSGYRSPTLNLKVGGSATSFHRLGCAADVLLGAKSKYKLSELFYHVATKLPYTELIAEGIPGGWLHIAVQRGREAEHSCKYQMSYDGIVRRSTIEEVMQKYRRYA